MKEYVLASNALYFRQFLEWLKTKQIAPMQVEVIDLAGIYDIQNTNVSCRIADMSI